MFKVKLLFCESTMQFSSAWEVQVKLHATLTPEPGVFSLAPPCLFIPYGAIDTSRLRDQVYPCVWKQTVHEYK
jgi:hypothetical protein